MAYLQELKDAYHELEESRPWMQGDTLGHLADDDVANGAANTVLVVSRKQAAQLTIAMLYMAALADQHYDADAGLEALATVRTVGDQLFANIAVETPQDELA
jgi:hypothetical protein